MPTLINAFTVVDGQDDVFSLRTPALNRHHYEKQEEMDPDYQPEEDDEESEEDPDDEGEPEDEESEEEAVEDETEDDYTDNDEDYEPEEEEGSQVNSSLPLKKRPLRVMDSPASPKRAKVDDDDSESDIEIVFENIKKK